MKIWNYLTCKLSLALLAHTAKKFEAGSLTHIPVLPITFYSPAHNHVEKAMALHSSSLAWKIPWTEEPGRLQSLGSR